MQFLIDTPGVLAVQPEFLYSQKGYTIGDFTQRVGYIQVNSLFKLKPPHVGVGIRKRISRTQIRV